MFCKISKLSTLYFKEKYIYLEAKEYANSVNAAFVETSALTAVNIYELFKEIGKLKWNWFISVTYCFGGLFLTKKLQQNYNL